jgi:hypothetical protein
MYADAARGTEGLQEYLARYIYGVDTHMEYLDLVGVESLVGLRVVGGNL